MAPEIKYTKLFIDNEWVDAKSGKTFETFNPHDASVIAKVAEGDKADIDLAVAAARRAFHRNSEWRLLEASGRRRLLDKFADLLERDAGYLAQLESFNNGTIIRAATHIIGSLPHSIRYLAGLADKYYGDTVPIEGNEFALTLKQPVGVCGLILPWNAPVPMFINKVVTALAAGCTVVVKPAEQTPLTALYLGALLQEAGVPAGVVNVVPGFGVGAGTTLTHHPDVDKISFTGSLEVGKLIQQAAGAENLKRITLELGGKSPLIIMEDADLDAAVINAGIAVFNLAGQMCVAASRLYVQASIYDKFVEKATEYAKSIKVGPPSELDSQHGPQIFGPVQSILKFDTLQEAIERANNTNYGLAAGIFTKSLDTALHFSKHVQAGTIWVNAYLAAGIHLPFGGFKDSGIGREKGRKALEAFLEEKTVVINLPKKI